MAYALQKWDTNFAPVGTPESQGYVVYLFIYEVALNDRKFPRM